MEWLQLLKMVRNCSEVVLLKQLIVECEARIRELRNREMIEWEIEQINDTDSLKRLRDVLMKKLWRENNN